MDVGLIISKFTINNHKINDKIPKLGHCHLDMRILVYDKRMPAKYCITNFSIVVLVENNFKQSL